jgi:hypothetical protein
MTGRLKSLLSNSRFCKTSLTALTAIQSKQSPEIKMIPNRLVRREITKNAEKTKGKARRRWRTCLQGTQSIPSTGSAIGGVSGWARTDATLRTICNSHANSYSFLSKSCQVPVSRVTGLRPESCWNDCLTRRKSIRPCTPLHVAYEVGAARQQTVRSPRTMYPHSQEWHRSRKATVYLPA